MPPPTRHDLEQYNNRSLAQASQIQIHRDMNLAHISAYMQEAANQLTILRTMQNSKPMEE